MGSKLVRLLAVSVGGLLLGLTSCQSGTESGLSVVEESTDTTVPVVETSTSVPQAKPSTTKNPAPTTESPAPLTELPQAAPVLPELEELKDPISGDIRLTGQPFETNGAMPAGIIASTEGCDVVAIDSTTGSTMTLWDYSGSNRWGLDCSESGVEYGDYSGTTETAPGFIEDVEWSEPQYVLVSLCCEPAAGRFEVLDTTTGQLDWLALDGGYPSINDQNRLLYSRYVGAPIGSIGFVPFDILYITSDLTNQHYQLQNEIYYHYFEQFNIRIHNNSFIRSVTWAGTATPVFHIWIHDEERWSSWVGYMDSEAKITINSRGLGWILPAGDQFGNLVVVEQQCTEPPGPCDATHARIVVVDTLGLAPVYEVEIEGAVADTDLVRGWLLVTLTDGQMGTLDLADGSFNVIAQGVRNAVWQE